MSIYAPYSIISINVELFISAQDGMYKSDNSLNLVGSFIRTSAWYTNIYYNSTSDLCL
jgi:hypothetical protein